MAHHGEASERQETAEKPDTGVPGFCYVAEAKALW